MAISHALEASAAPGELERLRRILGPHATDVIELYSCHDGLELYVQGSESGLMFHSASQWELATSTFKEEIEEWGRSEGDVFEFERRGVVFGEPVASGNWLLLYRGAVYYSNHDGAEDTPLAPTFSAFLDRIVEEPAKLLHDLGCYARYSDGTTDIQWIPERYVSRERPA